MPGGRRPGDLGALRPDLGGVGVKETISRITDKVIEEMTTWQTRTLDEVYAAIFLDANR